MGLGTDGVRWHPLGDSHAMGELRQFPLMRVTNKSGMFCLGCIGVDGQRFCWSTACHIWTHRKCRHELGCKLGFFITCTLSNSSQQMSAFRAPFLNADKMTPKVQAVVKDRGELGMKTTRKWEEFIPHAKVAWQIFQEDLRVGGRGGGILRKGSHEDGSLSKSVCMDLPDTPGIFTFAEQMVFGEVKFKAKKDREEGGEESKELDVGEDLREIRAAIWEMDTKMRHVVEGLHVDQVGMIDHLWKSIKLLGRAINQGDAQTRDLGLDVDDMLYVLEEHNIVDLSEGVSRVLGELDATKKAGLPLETLGQRINGLLKLINAVDEDHQKAGKFLLGKLKGTPKSSQQAAQGVIAPQGNLAMSMMILDDSGAQVGMLGELLGTMSVLQDNNTCLWVELSVLSSNITAQGGVVLDGLGFTTEAR
jgi:hypothetical protein